VIEPRLLNLDDLFADKVHYEVPIYQRPYVWARDEQWVPLWEDIRDVASRRLSGRDNGLAHFLGAIVIELISAEPGRPKTFSVIDGQQRLTTLQLVFAALRGIAAEKYPERVEDLEKFLMNTGRHTEGDLHLKVAPSQHDRPTFRTTISLVGGDVPAADDGIPGAYHFFASHMNEWLETDGDDALVQRFDALEDTLEGLLQVVAIQLDGTSDAQVIFETLNSRGADLTSLDLVKNSLLQQARRDGDDAGQLHAEYWEPALGDADYWFEDVRQGRYTRERADLFLMHWLTMRTAKVARVQHLFADFRKEIMRADPAPLARDLILEISDGAATYRSFDSFDALSVEGKFFRRLEEMDTTTLLPVALLLFTSEEVTPDRRQRALRALESWLVRRMILGSTAQAYNRLLASLLTTLRGQPSLIEVDQVIISALRAYDNPSDAWPTDDTVRRRLAEQPLYGVINARRIRMLLEACEERIANSSRTEGVAVPPGLTVEHALPQNWRDHWRVLIPRDTPPQLAEQKQLESEANRDAHVHRLGNLTLITGPLNSSLSDLPWSAKRGELADRSQLLINQRLCNNTIWDEELIDARGLEYANYVLETWPGPEGDWDADESRGV
jgi:Protein of unknown function DUF262/Protein of unknown function (DUF1524)